MAPFLRQVGGGEVHQHTLGRQRQAKRSEGGAHTLAAFAHGLVGQADNVEGVGTAGELHLHVDRACLHPFERKGRDAADHPARPHPLLSAANVK